MNLNSFSKIDAGFLFKNFTFSPLFYNFLIEVIPRLNIDINELEKTIHMKLSKIPEGERISIIKVYKFWKGIEKLSGRSDIGLIIADYFTISKAGIFGKLFIHTENLKESVTVMKKFLPLITNNINTKYVEINDNVIFYFDIVPRFVIPLSVSECYIKICHNWLKQYTGLNELPIKEINFYAKKPEHIEYYKKNFPNAKVSFNQHINYIVLDKSVFYIHNYREKYYPYQLILKHVQNLKKELFTKSSCTQKIINQIIANLPESNNHLFNITVRNLNISPSTLKRHLKEENTSFKKLTETIRKKLSFYMLQDKTLSFEEISYLLGYSEYSPFSRAFKRWYNISPSNFRNSYS